jgi:predicted MFS family arabinose efflux permease
LNELSQQGEASAPSVGYRNYVLFVLFLGYVVNSIDRSVLGILMPAIRHEFALSYTQVGLLGGLAFALFYATLGIPIAALADRTSRKWVLTTCIVGWSVMTALCGLAANFVHLILGRVGTATGEAGASPASHSLISDYFPPDRRGTALALYALGVSVGGIIGLPLAGLSNELWGWRTTFMLAGTPGLVVALLMATTVREPRRTHVATRKPGFGASSFGAIPELMRRAAFRNMALGVALHSFVWYGASTFNSLFLTTTHHMGTATLGRWLAVLSLAGAAGTFVGGMLADRLARRYADKRFYMWAPGGAAVLGIPFQVFGYLAPTVPLAMIGFAFSAFFASFFFGPSFAMGQALSSPSRRALSASVLLFIQTMIGLGIGPLVTGKITDVLLPTMGPHALQTALAMVALVNVWAGFHYWRAGRTVRADIAAAEASV